MKFLYLIIAGTLASIVHAYLVWHHRKNRKYSISEHAIIDAQSHILYFISHVICEVLIVLYAYQFFFIETKLAISFYLLVCFALLDFVQAALPSRGITEKTHFTAAYISWVSYLLAGVIALFQLKISEPYGIIAGLLFVPVLGMFIYMHINRSKLYPYQLMMVPIYTVAMLVLTMGSSRR